jgi:hypothetical protein
MVSGLPSRVQQWQLKRSCAHRTKIANKSEEVWPYKKRPNRTAFSGRKAHRDVKIPLHNGIMAEALKTRKHVEVHRPDSRLVLGYQSLTTTEVYDASSPC